MVRDRHGELGASCPVSAQMLCGADIPESVFFMFQMTFAIITPALIVGLSQSIICSTRNTLSQGTNTSSKTTKASSRRNGKTTGIEFFADVWRRWYPVDAGVKHEGIPIP